MRASRGAACRCSRKAFPGKSLAGARHESIAQACEPSLHPLLPHTSEERPADTCWSKRHDLADEKQICAEDRWSSRGRCRHSSAQGSRRTRSGDSLPALLRSFGRHPSPHQPRWPATRSPSGRRGGGDGGIRTLDRALQPYNGLANRRLQPLGHISGKADMPDAGASRKQISGRRMPSDLTIPAEAASP